MVLFHIAFLRYSYGKFLKKPYTILSFTFFNMSRSDFIYMVPPFLAYYGVVTRNRTLLAESYNQIQLYRNYLFDPTASLWKHVLLGVSQNDDGFWSTGTVFNLFIFSIFSHLRIQGTDGQRRVSFGFLPRSVNLSLQTHFNLNKRTFPTGCRRSTQGCIHISYVITPPKTSNILFIPKYIEL